MRWWPSRIRCSVAIRAAERLQGVTLESRIDGSSPLTSTIGLENWLVERQHVLVVERQEQAAGDLVIVARLLQHADLLGLAGDRPRQDLDAERLGTRVQPLQHVEGELVAHVVDHGDAARGEDHLAVGDRGGDRVVERLGGVQDAGAQVGPHALAAGQRPRGGADRHAALLRQILQPARGGWVCRVFPLCASACLSLELSRRILQRIFRLRKFSFHGTRFATARNATGGDRRVTGR